MTFRNIFFFLELPNWDFGVEIGAEVPETLKYTVAHWGPLAPCLEKGSGQSVPPVLGKTIWQLGTLQKRAFKKARGKCTSHLPSQPSGILAQPRALYS